MTARIDSSTLAAGIPNEVGVEAAKGSLNVLAAINCQPFVKALRFAAQRKSDCNCVRLVSQPSSFYSINRERYLIFVLIYKMSWREAC